MSGECPWCPEKQASIATLEARVKELKTLLGNLYDKYDSGVTCQEDFDGIYIGNAVKLDKEEEDRIIKALEKKSEERG